MGFIEGLIPQSPYRLSIQGEDVLVRQFQFVVCVSLTPTTWFTLPPEAPKFPVLLDTGHNHNFSITEKHLRAWARLEIQSFLGYPTTASINDSSGRQHEAPLYDGCLWLYSSDPNAPPLRVELDGGFTYYPANHELTGPRIPLLGARSLATARLVLTADFGALTFSLSPSESP